MTDSDNRQWYSGVHFGKKMRTFNKSLITIYATQELLDWLKKLKPELHRWTLDTINNRPTAYMIEIEDQNCHGDSLEKYYEAIIENELGEHLYIKQAHWPDEISYALFTQWFTYRYHEHIYDLCEKKLEIFEE